jgi:putative redox protein
MERRDALVSLTWQDDFKMEAITRGGAVTSIDGDGRAGPSPTQMLLESIGACSAIDVVDILRKGRQPLEGLTVEMGGERREEPPRRYTRLRLRFRVRGDVDRTKVERAVALSLDKYCSVFHSLDPELRETARVEIVVES